MIVAVMNLKGGVGKTTLATLMASVLANPEAPALLIDLDPQASSAGWIKDTSPSGIDLLLGPSRPNARKLADTANGYKHVVIDLPPRLDDANMVATMIADIVIVPVVPGQFDLNATSLTLRLLHAAQKNRPELDWRFVGNRIKETKLSKQLLIALAETGKLAKTRIKDRAAYAEWSQGKSSRGVAIHDVEKLVEEIEKIVAQARRSSEHKT
jgi:chromosome partitioning protein